MGCDIHLYVEVDDRNELCDILGESHWRFAPPTDDSPGTHSYGGVTWKHWYGARNYALFAWLAGVRNQQRIIPLDEPRGIPDDCSPITRAEHKQWGYDAHTASWYTLDEILRREVVKDFREQVTHSKFIEDMRKIVKQLGRDPSRIRIVFWFDN